MENEEHRKKKWDEMQSRLAEARGSIHHIELVSEEPNDSLLFFSVI